MKVFLSATFFLISILSYAQTEMINSNSIKQRSILLGASSSSNLLFSRLKKDSNPESNSSKRTSISLHSSLGYFIIDNLALGVSISVSRDYRSSIFSNHRYETTSNHFLVGPLIRYYIPTETMYPFIGASAKFGGSKRVLDFVENSINDRTDISTIMEYLIEAGIAIPVSKSVNFDIKGLYSVYLDKIKDDSDNELNHKNSFYILLGFSIILGND